MPIEIIVPRLGWSMEEGAFVAWLKKEGEFVKAGEPLFSIEGDKAIQDIESLDSGILRIAPNCPKPGQALRVGDVLGHLHGAKPSEAVSVVTPPKVVLTSAEPEFPLESPVHKIAVPQEDLSRPSGMPTISPRALRAAGQLGVEWTTIKGSGRTGRIREQDIRAAAGSKGANSVIQQLDALPAVECPCGWARRGFADVPNGAATVHLTEIVEDARTHYHKVMTEIYVVLEGTGQIELDGQLAPLKPLTAVMIRPGCRHRAIGKLRILNIAIPKFDPADEWFD
jgi:pyruvate/2-oxoglutarate dehydrogenase complex dihydrolipoamide acyltransferase (E2) component